MTDMRRTLLWVVFTMSLVLLWDKWTVHTGQPSMFGGSPRPVAADTAQPQPAAATPSAGVPAPSAAAVPGAAPAASAAMPALPAPTVAAPGTEKITLTTDVVKATFDSQGGTLVRLELLDFKDSLHRKWYEPFVELFSSNKARPELPNVLLFEQNAKRVYLAQTGLITAQPGVKLPNHLTQMTPVVSERTLKDGSNELQIRFESPAVDGLRLVKTYTLKRGEYTIGVKHEFINDSGKPVTPQLYLQLARDGNPPEGESSFYFTFTGPAMYTDAGKFQKIDFKDIEKGKADYPQERRQRLGGDGAALLCLGLAAGGQRAARVPGDEGHGQPVRDLDGGAAGRGGPWQQQGAAVDAVRRPAGREQAGRAGAGPGAGQGLRLVHHPGQAAVLAADAAARRARQLGLVDRGAGGAAEDRLLLAQRQRLPLDGQDEGGGPRVTELRERYKDKPQQMQQEMMRIYREEKVNPLGGCLPIVAQMPFFIALYWVLLSSVEMRNAPWILWIHDLSQPDPYFILPLLMTASTMFQTWLNPTPPDPVQAKMMWIMPLVFSVMFFFFPAGLVLYWLTNNILSIAQQWFINKKLGVLGK